MDKNLGKLQKRMENYPKPHMHPEEIELLTKYIMSSEKYFEFGSGGSTVHVFNIKPSIEIISLDNSKEWLDKVKVDLNEESKITQLYIDTGPVLSWGRPANEDKIDQWYHYYEAIDDHPDSDTILVDGRFRVCCVLRSALMCRTARIIIHDYSNREHYHVIEQFLECIDSVKTLSVFVPKDNLVDEEIKEVIEQYKYDYR